MNLTQRVLQKLGIEVQIRGVKGLALCPFHDDRNVGNFMVYVKGDRAGGYRCFSCGAHGGLVALVAHKRGCSRDGAREWLDALRVGEELEGDVEDAPAGVTLRVAPVRRRAFQLPGEVKFEPLEDWVTPARDYARARHLTADQIERWGIGYATSGRLAGRLVLPVRDSRGQARSYMARTFSGHETRYFYPSERERADQDCLFGEQHWFAEHRKECMVTVCEGALNALAVERADGSMYVAALGGSDPRPVHVGKLAAFGRVIVLMDEDRAGEGAAGILTAQLSRHTQVVRVSLGVGRDGRKRDADDLVPEELRDRLCNAIKP